MPDGKPFDRSDFIKTFNDIARHRHRYEVFRDFVTISAISLHNAIIMNETLEQEYLDIIAQYSKEEVSSFCKLLAILADMLEPEPCDALGSLYMDLDLGNSNTGQFFTPFEISLLMAQITHGDDLKKLDKPFITLSEPACGAGGMVLAFAKVMMQHNHVPAFRLWAQCIDIDRVAALMCYVQLTLWHIPAEVVVGNALTLETREVFYTPAHYMHGWDMKLNERRAKQLLVSKSPQSQNEEEPQALPQPLKTDKMEPIAEEPKQAQRGDDFQFDFGF